MEVDEFYLQAFNHGDDFHQGKFLLAGVVVPCGALILLCRTWTVLVAEFIRGMHQLPRVLRVENRSKHI